ncbi:PREDICTED: bolA-like protein 3 [Acropora digitifera]|uniref:bolA-like protein 3 n=1 Tax=Acropora digitifera TaxID=70779 RepID=UPI00077B1958|nr:PREDICTED: bolA-like protein 3 [Acropora digitifera]
MSWVGIVRGKVPHLCRQPSKVVLRALQVQAESEAEKKLAEILKKSFTASQITVRDISGGCGAMYEIFVESEDFRGKKQVHQHRLINQALGDEVKQMHGLRIFTAIPGENKG